MEKMRLKEARAMEARLAEELDALRAWRKRVAVVAILPGENPMDFIGMTVDELTKKIDDCMEKLAAARNVVRHAKIGITRDTGEEDLASMEERAALLMEEAALCQEMGIQNPRSREPAKSETAQIVNVTTYSIKTYAVRADRLRQKANELAAMAAKLDYETMVEI